MRLEPQEPNGKNRYTRGKNTKNRQEGVLLTFYKAGRKSLQGIKNHLYDSALQNDLILEILKPTERQRIRGSQIFNGNKYAVVKKPDDMAEIPDMMPIQDPTSGIVYYIRINFYGQVRYCARCEQQHPGQCQELIDFYKAKAERDAMEKEKKIKTKLFSDSTLRHANYIGLRADVLCMSGGGLGQVAQATQDDPDAEDKDNIVIIAGANDTKNAGYKNEQEFAESVDRSVDRMINMAGSDPIRHYVIVKSHPRKTDEHIEDENEEERKWKRTYIHKKIDQAIKEKDENNHGDIKAIDIEYDTDATGHPTIDGTKEILATLDKLIPQLIWKEEYITNERLYRGVQSVFRYGCNHCERFGEEVEHKKHNNYNVCDICMDKVKQSAENKKYPILSSMAESGKNKRNRESDSEDDDTNRKLKDKYKDTDREDGEISDEEMPDVNPDDSDENASMISVPENKKKDDGNQSDASSCSTNTITSDN